MLSNFDIDELVKKMEIPNFQGCYFKDELNQLSPESSYIINLHSKFDADGNINPGSHWCVIVTDDMNRAIYFDPYGEGCPEDIKVLAKHNGYKIGHCKKNIQSLMSDLCGFFCLGFIYFLTVYKKRTENIIVDAGLFLDLFEDLDKVNDIFKNEFILSLFFTDKATGRKLFNHNNVGISSENHLPSDFEIEEKPLRV